MRSKPLALFSAGIAALLAGCGEPGDAAPVANDAATAVATPETPPAPEPSAAPTPDATASAEAPQTLGIDGEGLRWVNAESGVTRAVPFGTPRATTLAALTTLGKPELGAQEECGEGPIQTASYPNGLTVHFQEDKFVGWFLDKKSSKALTTMAGLGIGASRADIDRAYAGVKVEESTIGHEFAVGEMGGLLDGTGKRAKVTDLWAGVACIFR